MRQTLRFDAVRFEASPVEVEVMEDAEPPDPETLPVALLAFESGSLVLTLPVGTRDAESLMNAFTQAEPYREEIPPGHGWSPQPVGLPGGLLWALTPSVVGVSVTPPQNTPEGVVPFWTLAFDDAEGSQVQVAVSDALAVQVIRARAQVAEGEAPAPDG